MLSVLPGLVPDPPSQQIKRRAREEKEMIHKSRSREVKTSKAEEEEIRSEKRGR